MGSIGWVARIGIIVLVGTASLVDTGNTARADDCKSSLGLESHTKARQDLFLEDDDVTVCLASRQGSEVNDGRSFGLPLLPLEWELMERRISRSPAMLAAVEKHSSSERYAGSWITHDGELSVVHIALTSLEGVANAAMDPSTTVEYALVKRSLAELEATRLSLRKLIESEASASEAFRQLAITIDQTKNVVALLIPNVLSSAQGVEIKSKVGVMEIESGR